MSAHSRIWFLKLNTRITEAELSQQSVLCSPKKTSVGKNPAKYILVLRHVCLDSRFPQNLYLTLFVLAEENFICIKYNFRNEYVHALVYYC